MTQSNVNDSATNASTRTGSAQPRSGPVRYRLITPSGHGMGTFGTALEAASTAGGFRAGDPMQFVTSATDRFVVARLLITVR